MEQSAGNVEMVEPAVEQVDDSSKVEEIGDSKETCYTPVLKDDDIIIDRNPVALAFCEVPNVHSKNILDISKGSEDAVKVFEEIAGLPNVVRNNTEVRKAASVKSFGYDTESEFEFSEDDSDFGDDYKSIRNDAKDSDDEFDRIVKYSCKIIEKIHKSEYPESIPPSSKKAKKPLKVPQTKNIHEYDDLPPIENLSISCESSLIEFGFVSKVVDCMVLVESTSTEVLDFDSYLFDVNSKAIGQVYDIFGQVKTPCYAIRFNSQEEASLVPINMKVYFAPNEEELTKTPFKGLNLAAASRDTINNVNRQMDRKDAIERTKQMKERIEGVDSEVEFSDDEAEKEYRINMKTCNISENNRGRKRDRRGAAAGNPRKVRFENQNEQTAPGQSRQNYHQNNRGRGRRGGFRGNQRPGQWDWHSNPTPSAPRQYRRDFDGSVPTATSTSASTATVTQPQEVVVAAPSSVQNPQPEVNNDVKKEGDNPYAEFGCYSGYSGRFGI